jgi:hypothetical protein
MAGRALFASRTEPANGLRLRSRPLSRQAAARSAGGIIDGVSLLPLSMRMPQPCSCFDLDLRLDYQKTDSLLPR